MSGILSIDVDGDSGALIKNWLGDPTENAAKFVPDDNSIYICPVSSGWGSACHNTTANAGEESGIDLPDDTFPMGTQVRAFAQDSEGTGTALGNTTTWGTAVDPPDAPELPTAWTYANLALSVSTAPQVSGFHVDEVGNDIVATWNRFAGAYRYRIQVRRDSENVYTEFASVMQSADSVQTYTYASFADDARFVPGQNYVFRIRAEAL